MRYLVVLLATGCAFRAGLAPSDGPADPPHDTSVGSATAIDAAVDAEMIDAAIDAPRGIHFVQGSGSYTSPWGNDSETLDVTFGSDVAAGDVIAVYFSYDDGAGFHKITDSAGDTFQVVETNSGDGGQTSVGAWAIATASGALTVTGNMYSDDCCLVLFAHDIAGVDTSSPVDGHQSHSQDSVDDGPNNVSSNSFAGHAGDYIFGGTTDPSNSDVPAITAGTGFTLRVDPTVPTSPRANATATEDTIETATGQVAATFTFAAGRAITIAIAFLPAS